MFKCTSQQMGNKITTFDIPVTRRALTETENKIQLENGPIIIARSRDTRTADEFY